MASPTVVFMLTIALGAVATNEMAPPIRGAGTRYTPGSPAGPKQFPYMASIWIEGHPTQSNRLCGGSLITREAVLTEAWCIEGFTKFTVRLGSIYRTADDSNAWTVVSIWSLSHPDYVDENYYSNVGIIYLPREAPLNDYIQLVELPSSANVGTFMCCHGLVSGWGKITPDGPLSEELRWGDMTVIPNKICEKYYKKDRVNNRSMCAGSEASKIHGGDTGAPFVIRDTRRHLQIGVYSTGVCHYNTSKPVIFSRLSCFVEWIRLNTVTNPARNDRRRQSSPHPHPHISQSQ